MNLHSHHQLRTALFLLGSVLSLAMIASAQQPAAKSADDYVAAGIAAQAAGKHEEALPQYATALKLQPKNFLAHYNSGVAYSMLQKFEEALKAFQAAVALEPREPQVHLALGDAYAANGRTLEAIDALKEAIRL
ncbi:MAG: hypothetical protein QOD75_2231, partial [Blastocatellia bacterium]|nr:hypothetical protein [Blastocatellia bacterium]